MINSMSRKGNCWDNASTERLRNGLKNKRVLGTHFGTQVEASPLNFLEDWTNTQHEEKLAA